MIERKRKGKTIETDTGEAPARGGNVIDLMAALKRSIEKPGSGEEEKKKPAAKKAAPKKAPAKKAPAKHAPARKRA
jgi:DNA end-binding protein Ku